MCSSVWPKRKVVKWKIKAKAPLFLPLLLEWCCLWQKARPHPSLPNGHPVNIAPCLSCCPILKQLQYDEALYISYGHLLSENLSEDVVRDVLTAPTPGHPLAHTCRGSSTKNPTRSSALTLVITFYSAISHPRKKETLPPMILTRPLEANRSNRYNIWILEIREDLCHKVNF